MSRSRPEAGWASLSDAELRAELEARGLDAEGARDELAARLDDADAAAEQDAPTGDAGDAQPAEAEASVPGEGEPEAEASEAAEGEPEAEQPATAPEEPATAGRRRGSAETSTVTPRGPAPRRPDGSVVVRARAKYVRSAPRKARLVMRHIRGRPVEQARAILVHTPRSVSADVLKLLNSAVANAESNHELAAEELRVERAFVDEGPTIKRYRPRALGRATRINKRTSHMTIELTTAEQERR